MLVIAKHRDRRCLRMLIVAVQVPHDVIPYHFMGAWVSVARGGSQVSPLISLAVYHPFVVFAPGCDYVAFLCRPMSDTQNMLHPCWTVWGVQKNQGHSPGVLIIRIIVHGGLP